MNLLLDENVEPGWARLLQQQFRSHTFSTTEAQQLRGVDDEDLFRGAAERGFDALITNDVRQMEREHERRALFTAGLSWVGIQTAPRSQGRQSALLRLSTLIAGLAVLDDHWHAEPWAYLLLHVTATHRARVDSFDIWRDTWASRS